jgi:hypothetical protein
MFRGSGMKYRVGMEDLLYVQYAEHCRTGTSSNKCLGKKLCSVSAKNLRDKYMSQLK